MYCYSEKRTKTQNTVVLFSSVWAGFLKQILVIIPWRGSGDRASGVRRRHASFTGEEILQVHVHQHKVGTVRAASLLALREILKACTELTG